MKRTPASTKEKKEKGAQRKEAAYLAFFTRGLKTVQEKALEAAEEGKHEDGPAVERGEKNIP